MVPAGSAESSRAPPTRSRRAPAAARRGWCPTPGWRTGRPGPPARGHAVLCSSSQSAVSCQYCGIASNVARRSEPARSRPARWRRPARPVTTTPTATRLSRSGWANASRSTRPAVRFPAAGCGPADAPDPSASGSRSSGSSLWMLRSGVPCGVEECLNMQGPQAIPDRRSIPAASTDDAEQQDGDEPSARRHRPHRQPGQTGGRHQRGREHRDRTRSPMRRPPWRSVRRTVSRRRCRAASRSATSTAWSRRRIR